MVLGILSVYLLKSRVVSIVLLILMVAPLFFLRLLVRKFTKKIAFTFYDDYFITVVDDKIENTVSLNRIKSYCLQLPNERYNSIKLRTKDDKAIEYSFFQRKQNNEDTDADELIRQFRLLINDFNKKSSTDRIELRPSFFASKQGQYTIVALVGLLIFGMILWAFFSEKSLPFTFVFSVLLIIQMMVRRKRELDYYKAIREIE